MKLLNSLLVVNEKVMTKKKVIVNWTKKTKEC